MSEIQKHTVLVIDDEEFILSSLYRLLRREFNVLIANTASEGLELMRHNEVHVVVSDQRMPEMVGVEFFSIIQGEFPDAIRMLLTGYSDLESVIAAINTGNIYRYIVKPWNPDELLNIVREACVKYDLIVKNRKLTKELMETNVELEQRVLERTNQLARSNDLITDLNHAAIQLQTEFDIENINYKLEEEFKNLQLHCSVVLLGNHPIPFAFDSSEQTKELAKDDVCKLILQSIPVFKKMLVQQKPEFIELFYKWFQKTFSKKELTLPCALSSLADVGDNSHGLFLPLIARDGFLGALVVWGDLLEKDDISPLMLFANQLALIIENANYFETFKLLAETDSLTGVFNRRKIMQLAHQEFNRALRLNQNLSVMMIDLNRFKQINDVFGHLIGDDVLKYAANTMQASIRKDVDSIGRYGGDEFFIILPDTNQEQVGAAANRLRKNFETKKIQFAEGLDQVFISVGTATMSSSINNLSQLIDLADQNMYKQKNGV
ncbi:MAG TPA: diguanylate cyclase [Anaerolineaceae bacterium]|nr:diguanylate cyclase [Anaerolineaceae bacterium]